MERLVLMVTCCIKCVEERNDFYMVLCKGGAVGRTLTMG